MVFPFLRHETKPMTPRSLLYCAIHIAQFNETGTFSKQDIKETLEKFPVIRKNIEYFKTETRDILATASGSDARHMRIVLEVLEEMERSHNSRSSRSC